MAFRGRGRGRGQRRGGPFAFAKQEPFVEFPEIELPDRKVKEERALVLGNAKFLSFWKSSPYFLEESILKKNQSMDIERYSDWGKPKTNAKRDALSNFLLLDPVNFPKELVAGAKWEQPNPKKVRWNPNSDLKKWDALEKLEKKFQGRDEKDEKEKKNDEDEDDEDKDDGESEDAEEEPSDDDYYQNQDFDDDDDDYNDVDDGNDEAEY